MIILIPLLVAILGVLLYALAVNPKLQEIGRIAYAFGLLVVLWNVGAKWATLFAR